MTDNLFFKPTVKYKEFMILDLIEKDNNITQRYMSDVLGVAVSMINSYLNDYEEKGFIKRKYLSSKTVTYHITKKGIERKKLLNISYLNATQVLYNSAKLNIVMFLNQIIDKGFKNILLYGAGEVAEILLNVINNDKELPLNVEAVIDDDLKKQDKYLVNTKIVGPNKIEKIEHDGILIASYTHNNAIYSRLKANGYNVNNIIEFFELNVV